jgi:phage shock protein A
MGIFSRTGDVKNSDLTTLLDRAEDPVKTVRLIINEMEDTLVEARSTAVRALARKKEIQRQIINMKEQAEDWSRKAELAVSKSREDLARGALALKLRVLAEITSLEKLLPPVDAEIERLDADLAELRAKVAEAKSRQKLLLLRGETINSRRQIKTQVKDKAGPRGDAMDDLARQIDHVESEVEAYDLGSRKLANQFAELESSDAVETELNRLRGKLGKPAAPTS